MTIKFGDLVSVRILMVNVTVFPRHAPVIVIPDIQWWKINVKMVRYKKASTKKLRNCFIFVVYK